MSADQRLVALFALVVAAASGCGGAGPPLAATARPTFLEAGFPELVERANAWTAAALRAEGQLRMYWSDDEDSRHVDARLYATRSGALALRGSRSLAGQIFTLTADGFSFRLEVPDHAAIYTGTAEVPAEPDPERPYFSLRPHHITEALLPEPLPTTSSPGSYVTLETFPERYALVWVEVMDGEVGIRRRVWIDRLNLRVSQIEAFGDDGRIAFVARYSDYLGPDPSGFPGRIEVQRPWERLIFRFDLEEAEPNPPIPAVAFRFREPPPGYRTLSVEQALAEFRAQRGEGHF